MESLRFAPSVTQPIGTPLVSVATDHFHPGLASVGRIRSGSLPAQGALCSDPSTDTSERSSPIILSKASMASSTRCPNAPAATHSSRRRRRVVSLPLPRRPATSQLHPVTKRNKMASKQSRSEMPGPVAAQGMVGFAAFGQVGGKRRPDGIDDAGLECKHGTSTGSLGWDDSRIMSGPHQRPVDLFSWSAVVHLLGTIAR